MLSALLSLFIVNTVCLISPGPDFFMVSQTSVSRGRRAGFAAALGLLTGISFWALSALLGLRMLFMHFPWLQSSVTAAGGLYLLWIAFGLLKGVLFPKPDSEERPAQRKPLQSTLPEGGFLSSYLRGLLTNLTNPKVLIFFSSVFTVFMPPEADIAFEAVVFFMIIITNSLWFNLVVLIFSLPKIRIGYMKAVRWIDGLAGLIFAGYGGALMFEVCRNWAEKTADSVRI